MSWQRTPADVAETSPRLETSALVLRSTSTWVSNTTQESVSSAWTCKSYFHVAENPADAYSLLFQSDYFHLSPYAYTFTPPHHPLASHSLTLTPPHHPLRSPLFVIHDTFTLHQSNPSASNTQLRRNGSTRSSSRSPKGKDWTCRVPAQSQARPVSLSHQKRSSGWAKC